MNPIALIAASFLEKVAKPSLDGELALLGTSVTGILSVETDVGSNKHLFL